MRTRKPRLPGKNYDPNQTEFGIIWQLAAYPFRLRAGDIIQLNHRLGRILRVNECSAVVLMHQPLRQFKTWFDKSVRFQPPPRVFRISPQSDVPILNRRTQR